MIYIVNLIYVISPNCGCLPTNLCISPCVGMGPHVREGVKKHDIHCESKSDRLKLLGKLVVQQQI